MGGWKIAFWTFSQEKLWFFFWWGIFGWRTGRFSVHHLQESLEKFQGKMRQIPPAKLLAKNWMQSSFFQTNPFVIHFNIFLFFIFKLFTWKQKGKCKKKIIKMFELLKQRFDIFSYFPFSMWVFRGELWWNFSLDGFWDNEELNFCKLIYINAIRLF